ncbi:hypothetical protein [Pasteuria penetrans]|uniref:hypothetical protein n=1 Tax=Pasteuria penetrans TaxID=86005 RepID=UPI0011EE8AD4|nr:hypothetical protein [Pasteuria penetrans]
MVPHHTCCGGFKRYGNKTEMITILILFAVFVVAPVLSSHTAYRKSPLFRLLLGLLLLRGSLHSLSPITAKITAELYLITNRVDADTGWVTIPVKGGSVDSLIRPPVLGPSMGFGYFSICPAAVRRWDQSLFFTLKTLALWKYHIIVYILGSMMIQRAASRWGCEFLNRAFGGGFPPI